MTNPTTTTKTPAPNLFRALLEARAAMTNQRNLPREGMEEAWKNVDQIIRAINSTRLLDMQAQNIAGLAMELHSAGVTLLDLELRARNADVNAKRWYAADQATREALGAAGITLPPESEEAADGVRELAKQRDEAITRQAAPAVLETLDARRDQIELAAKALKAVVRTNNLPGLPTLAELASAAAVQLETARQHAEQWRHRAGSLEGQVKVQTDEHKAVLAKLGEANLATQEKRRELERLTLDLRQCHELLDLRGGPPNNLLRDRIAAILDDRDNAVRRQGELQAEADEKAALARRITAALAVLDECPRKSSMIERATNILRTGQPTAAIDHEREPTFPVWSSLDWHSMTQTPTTIAQP